MSQQEILTLLEKEKKPMSRGEIADKLDTDPNKVSMLLRKLVDTDSIKYIEIDRYKAKKLSLHPRKQKLYFA